MSSKIGSSLSYVSTSLPSPFQSRRSSLETFYTQQLKKVQVVKPCRSILDKLKLNEKYPKMRPIFCAISEEQLANSELETDHLVQEADQSLADEVSLIDSLCTETEGAGGKPGSISFYNCPYRIEDKILVSNLRKNRGNLLWLVGPGVLVASFIFPSLYLRRILSTIFEDSLLTDFLILFSMEAIFCCRAAVFLLLIDHLRRPTVPLSSANVRNICPQLGHRISSVQS